MSESIFDVIVLGVGGMGSATVYELARRGRRVLGLEQFKIGHDLGSSHGQTRIIRKAYYEHPDYVPLVSRSFERWYDLEQRSGQHLLTECGCLSIGRADSSLLQGVRDSAALHHLPVEDLAANDLRTRFPAFQFSDEYLGVLEHSAGFLAVEQCVLVHIQEATRLGAVIRVEETASSWQATNSGVTVRTAKGEYHAAKLIITAGPWATQLLGRLGATLTVMRQVALWFGASQPGLFRRDLFPLYMADIPAGLFYGFPLLNTDHGIKVAQHYGAPELRGPADIHRSISVGDEEALRPFLRDHLPHANGPLRHSSVCIYTLTPDRHFLMGLHPEHTNVALAAGFSGHGFKFAPVVGEIMSDLIEHGRTDQPIRLFRLDRFQNG